jgi:hypothetical protein
MSCKKPRVNREGSKDVAGWLRIRACPERQESDHAGDGLHLLLTLALAYPMFDTHLFRIRAFAAGNIAGLLASVSRGELMFMPVIWLQGIWLPLHGFSFVSTPLWAGIYMLPLTSGSSSPDQPRAGRRIATAPDPSPPEE